MAVPPVGRQAVRMHLRRHPDELAVVRLPPGAAVPDDLGGVLVSVTRTAGETSVVCARSDATRVADGAGAEGVELAAPWAVLEVVGPLDLSLTGILARLSAVLAEAGVPVFALATYDTDWLLVEVDRVADAIGALRAHGHRVDPA